MKKIVLTLLIAGAAMLYGQEYFQHIEKEFRRGNFEKAEKQIDVMLQKQDLSQKDRQYLEDKKCVMNRIRLDFGKTEDDMYRYLKPYYPDLDSDQLRDWEDSNSLECMVIDGRKRYFNNAGPNLFRINKEAGEVKISVDGPGKNVLQNFLNGYLPETVNKIERSADVFGPVTKMKLHYTVSLDADAIPAGEMVSAWLPFPKESHARQTGVELLNCSEENYVIAPDSYAQRSIYMQKAAEAGKKTEFSITLQIETRAQWYDLKPDMIRPYDKRSALYKEFTGERQHIQFSDDIRKISEKVVGNEKNPYLIVRKIFSYISENYPWASAREYSTIENIPEYCIANHKGDCGQVTLLFMTLARYNGIPAKWQSGWMLHPGDINLHDWCEVYFEGIGWVPVDQSFGLQPSDDERVKYYYSNGIDAYRLIVNDDYGQPFFPAKIHLRSETVDFQRGELDWRGGNLYFNKWSYHMDVEYLK